ncbi:hypothetical protein COX93_01290 [Candidatus Nomurabacteria bacterium CG_4_10_14_0_2_um_filter_30_12]|uniref:Glucosamine/galactosamine-6-phosphate isomerase domain-containing protein n=2 Tax=Candidatus Nomuraibacteriota TaxID=1752729 RepID=A0A2J0MJR8_9BACT|nr:MAG: hypothetical protein COU48_02685 [Candidatus Nomurabacteria bacterium CG10_big_fil_rev_8_21_14_0_10_03_31_7]PIZ87344.1 MAG: hypothetical protein COX93_01290 [Candidatus Nomurabacteria bacterium CG_4_10_14_0_2_um_filter_30_12]
MNIALKNTKDIKEVSDFIASSILKQLDLDKKVLFFIAGGSSVSVAVAVANNLKKDLLSNLVVVLTDERYGEVSHKDSNFFQLIEKGFDIPQAKIIPVLNNDDKIITVEKFSKILGQELKKSDYKIALFGIGADGHVAGILPYSGAVYSEDLVYGYDTPTFSRITITPKVIKDLDEAIVWAQGENKWEALENLEKDIDINLAPAQILKKVPLLTIFTDYKN